MSPRVIFTGALFALVFLMAGLGIVAAVAIPHRPTPPASLHIASAAPSASASDSPMGRPVPNFDHAAAQAEAAARAAAQAAAEQLAQAQAQAQAEAAETMRTRSGLFSRLGSRPARDNQWSRPSSSGSGGCYTAPNGRRICPQSFSMPLQIKQPPAPTIHFVGERLPGVKQAVELAFQVGFDAGAAGGGLAGLTVGSVLGLVGASLVWAFIVFCIALVAVAARRGAATVLLVLALGSTLVAGEASPAAAPWETCVRVKVFGGNAISCGSGTVIAGQPGDCFVITCGHVFAESGKGGRVAVDLFDGRMVDQQVRYRATVGGRCVDFDPSLDVGLIAIDTLAGPLPASPPVPRGWLPRQGEVLAAAGCGGAQDAILWNTRAIKITRGQNGYVGIECSQAPSQGRSGGGLYRADGRLVGVCDFASPDTDTGIYAAPSSIHTLLDRNGLSRLYQTVATAPVARKPAPVAPKPERRPYAVPEPIPNIMPPAGPAVDPNPPPPPASTEAAEGAGSTAVPGSPAATATPPTPESGTNPLILVGALSGLALIGLLLFGLLVLLKRRKGDRPLFGRSHKPADGPAPQVAGASAATGPVPEVSVPPAGEGASIVRGLAQLFASIDEREAKHAQEQAAAEAAEAAAQEQAQHDAEIFERLRELFKPASPEAAAEPATVAGASDPK